MRLRVLGCHGGELPDCRSTCFLIDDALAIDAGALTSALTLPELDRVEHILVSHSHFDHVKDLPMVTDNLVLRRKKPITVWASTACARTLKTHMFNQGLWPDFTRIPTRAAPALVYRVIPEGSYSRVCGLSVKPVRVNHPVFATGFILREPGTSIIYSGDTGPTEAIWKAARRLPDLQAVIVECSFPNALEEVALASGHLTPALLERELERLGRPEVPVYLYHMKPLHLADIARELAEMSRPVDMLCQGRRYTFSAREVRT